MNFSQLQDRVRQELQRRIDRGSLSVSLLARQTGMGQPHLSNFLHGRRHMSLKALDEVLRVMRLRVSDLVPAARDGALLREQIADPASVPIVTHQAAMYEPYIRASSVLRTLPFATEDLAALKHRCTAARKQWERFVAVRMSAEEVAPMEPLARGEGIAVLDRHWNSLAAYFTGEPNLYAARSGSRLLLRYADFLSDRLVLRAQEARYGIEVIELGGGETASDLIAGRVTRLILEK